MIASQKLSKGFTIVELLIVIVVIAILAAISIVMYNGIRQRAVTAAYTSAVDQWEKLLKAEMALKGPLPTTTSICLGKSSMDFPDLQDGFTSGQCVRASGSGVVSYSYNDSYFSSFELQNSIINGSLPVTTFTIGGVTYTSRGISMAVAASTIQIQWFPQVSGQCGRGMPLVPGDGSLDGGACTLFLPNR